MPLKDFDRAKSRLAPALSPFERRGLFRAMAEDVLSAMVRVPGLEGVVVVTRDGEARALAERYGAAVLEDRAVAGQTAAVSAAAQTLAAAGVATMLALPGDIPLATPGEIGRALAAHAASPRRPAVTIVPAWDRRGSNCMVCSPPDVIPFRFGNDSFGPHRAEALARGVEALVVPMPGIGLDVDNPADLRMLLGHNVGGRTRAFLDAAGIPARLAFEEPPQ